MPDSHPPQPSSRRFAKHGDYVVRCIGGETILVPVSAGVADLDAIYVLNGAAAVVWSRLDGRASVADLVAAVTQEYEVTDEEAAADVQSFLQSLSDDGLVVPADLAASEPAADAPHSPRSSDGD